MTSTLLRIIPLILCAPLAAQDAYSKAVSLHLNDDKLPDVVHLKGEQAVVMSAPGTVVSETDLPLSGCVDLLAIPDPSRAVDALLVATDAGIMHVTWVVDQFVIRSLSPPDPDWNTVEHMDRVPETGDIVAQLSGGEVRRLIDGGGAFPWVDAGGFSPTMMGSELVVADLDSNLQSEIALLTTHGVDIYDQAGGVFATYTYNAATFTNAMCLLDSNGTHFLAISASIPATPWGVIGFIGQTGLVSMSLLPDPGVVGMATGRMGPAGDTLDDLVLSGTADAFVRVLHNVGTAALPDVDSVSAMDLLPFSVVPADNEAYPVVFDVDGDADDDIFIYEGGDLVHRLYRGDAVDEELITPDMVTIEGPDQPTLTPVSPDRLDFSFTAVVPANPLGRVLEVTIYMLDDLLDTSAEVIYDEDFDLLGALNQPHVFSETVTLHQEVQFTAGNLCGSTPKLFFLLLRTAKEDGVGIVERHPVRIYGLENMGTDDGQQFLLTHSTGVPFSLNRVCIPDPGNDPGTIGSVGTTLPCVPVNIPPF